MWGVILYELEHYPFQLKPLAYSYEALCPYINACTLHFHHDKHLGTYVENLNKALAPFPAFHCWSMEMLLTNINDLPEEIRMAVWNNGGGVYNHQLYFDSMTCRRKKPDPVLYEAILNAFGSTEEWKRQMKEAAVSQFGSGWAWTVADANGCLGILKTSNQDTVLPYTPLLLVDVWEHAYYLQYQNRRADYLENWFCLIDWDVVGKRYQQLYDCGRCDSHSTMPLF